jgi:hypothetical protein
MCDGASTGAAFTLDVMALAGMSLARVVGGGGGGGGSGGGAATKAIIAGTLGTTFVTNSSGTTTIVLSTTTWSALESNTVSGPPLGMCFVFPVIKSNMATLVLQCCEYGRPLLGQEPCGHTYVTEAILVRGDAP